MPLLDPPPDELNALREDVQRPRAVAPAELPETHHHERPHGGEPSVRVTSVRLLGTMSDSNSSIGALITFTHEPWLNAESDGTARAHRVVVSAPVTHPALRSL